MVAASVSAARPSLRLRWPFLIVLLLGVGVLLVWLVESHSSAAFALAGTVRHPSEMGPGRPLQMAFVRPGDHIHFRVSSRRAGFLAVIGVGGQTGRETVVYYPPAPNAAPLEAGEVTDLPAPIVADERVGNERVYGFLCKEALAVAEIREEFARAIGAVSNYGLARGSGLDLPCETAVLGFTKCDPDECP